MHLRHGATVERAIQGLSEIITESQQPRNIGQPAELRVKLNTYLNWVFSAQTRLRLLFSDTELEDSLLARAYWHVSMSSVPPSPELGRLVDEELVFQLGILEFPETQAVSARPPTVCDSGEGSRSAEAGFAYLTRTRSSTTRASTNSRGESGSDNRQSA
jgi:hypothetical protein